MKFYFGINFPSILKLNILNVICSLFGVCAFFGLWGGPFIATSWFIGVIITLYLLFPFLSKGMKKTPEKILVGTFIISIISRYLLAYGYMNISGDPLNWFPFSRLFEFSLGMYIARKVKVDLLLPLAISKKRVRVIKYLSDLSFPLFLIHYPFLSVIGFLTGRGLPLVVVIAIYCGIVISISSMVLLVSNFFISS